MAEPTKADLEARVAELEAENTELARQRDEAALRVAELATSPRRPANPQPRFELSAGEQHDLAVHGVTRSARTGKTITAEDFPDAVDVDALSAAAVAAIAAENTRRARVGQ